MSSSINSPMSCLELKQLRVEIGDKIVCKDLSLTIAPNERWALLGKNGVGKTTLLHSLLSLHKPVAGEIRINNHWNDFNKYTLALIGLDYWMIT